VATITVRGLEEPLKKKLRIRAAMNGRSMEDEVRAILKRELLSERSDPRRPLGDSIRARFAAFGGIDLAIPDREAMREPPDFNGNDHT
jgi:plasmid stability protein